MRILQYLNPSFATRLLPWLELNSNNLYLSNENYIQIYNHNRGQKRLSKPTKSIVCGEHDITRFVVKGNLLIIGSKHQVFARNMKDKSNYKMKTFVGHSKSVYCVEALGDVVLSGSRDRSIKVSYYWLD